jgi:hypothetical protein
VDYARSGTALGHAEVAFLQGNVWARTEYTAGWVKLGGAVEGLAQEAEKLLTGK